MNNDLKTLLLNNNYEILSFITIRKAIKLYLNGKVETISIWAGNEILFSSGHLDHPSIMRMNYKVNRNNYDLQFSRFAVFKRDHFICQFCGFNLNSKTATLEHLLPRVKGGKSTFENCITACKECNQSKGQKTLEQSGLSLIKKPFVPSTSIYYFSYDWTQHPEWENYVKIA